IDKYYQIARCFRDEDLRADRQPEFTQVDMEMSFVDQEQILEHLEKMFKYIFEKNMGIKFEEPFPRLTWRQCMDMYGTDKPDLRFGLPIIDLTEQMRNCGFSVFRKAVEAGGYVRAINVKGCGDFTRTTIENLTAKAQSYGAKGMAWIAMKEDGTPYSILTKYFTEEEFDRLLAAVDAKAGDFILFCADKYSVVCRTLGNLRLDLADMLDLRKKDDFKFLIVTDFPEFEYSEEEGRYLATHHPFTMPYPEDIPYLISDPARVRAQAYDFVLNGYELGSGSIRIHRRDIQQKMFEALGFSPEQIEERFGFMVNAFRYGTPPHGGFAFGLDRLVMLMLGEDSLREVIAFPKTKDASCPMTDAPNTVDKEQLDVLGLAELFGPSSTVDFFPKSHSDKIDIETLSELSNLHLSDKEKKEYTEEMQQTMPFVNQILDVDTTGVAETTHVQPLKNVLREDVPQQDLSRDEMLESAPQKKDGYIFVPEVLE
ncbi:MAG TPA: aspartate--tRNA ligase, partial [Candidatus Avimonas sp.]|nr:aspartate--tRNA ligase [Candidatus Avimonas sp.]